MSLFCQVKFLAYTMSMATSSFSFLPLYDTECVWHNGAVLAIFNTRWIWRPVASSPLGYEHVSFGVSVGVRVWAQTWVCVGKLYKDGCFPSNDSKNWDKVVHYYGDNSHSMIQLQTQLPLHFEYVFMSWVYQ